METTTLVTQIKDDFLPEVGRTTILGWLNLVQNKLFSQNCANTLLFDTAQEFPFPYLKTTDSVLTYNLNSTYLTVTPAINGYATTVRAVKDLYIEVNTSYDSSTRQYGGERFVRARSNPGYTKTLIRNSWERVPRITIKQTGAQATHVIFPENPGTYTNRYIIECYLNAISLTAETIPLSVNGDEYFDVLLDGVVGYSELVANGNSERWQRFLTVGCNKFWTGMNEGDEFRPLQIGKHEC